MCSSVRDPALFYITASTCLKDDTAPFSLYEFFISDINFRINAHGSVWAAASVMATCTEFQPSPLHRRHLPLRQQQQLLLSLLLRKTYP